MGAGTTDERRLALAKRWMDAIAADRTAREAAPPESAPADPEGGRALPPRLAAALQAYKPPPPRTRPRPGEIWTVRPSAPRDLPVLAALTDRLGDDFAAVFVSSQLWLAATDDVVVPPDDSPTGDPLVLCAWRPLRLRREQLVEAVGDLPRSALDALRLLARRGVPGSVRRHATGSIRIEGLPLMTWEAWTAEKPDSRATFFTGSRVLAANDPRPAARDLVRDYTSALLSLAAEATGVEEAMPTKVPLWRLLADQFRRAVDRLPEILLGAPDSAGGLIPALEPAVLAAVRGARKPQDVVVEERTFRLPRETTAVVSVSFGDKGMTAVVHAARGGRDLAGLDIRIRRRAGTRSRDLAAGKTNRAGILRLGPVAAVEGATYELVVGSRLEKVVVEFGSGRSARPDRAPRRRPR